MKTTILHANNNIIDNNLYYLGKYGSEEHEIRIINAGVALENLIKDALCVQFQLPKQERIELQSECPSYTRNQNNGVIYLVTLNIYKCVILYLTTLWKYAIM